MRGGARREGAGDGLVSDHNLLMGAGVGDQVGVSVLQEGGEGGRLAPGTAGPGVGGLQAQHQGGIGFEKRSRRVARLGTESLVTPS